MMSNVINVPRARLSDDWTCPFTCENCQYTYEDYPALIIVKESPNTYRYCSDACAEDAGWSEAVHERWATEVSGSGLAIIFTPSGF